MSVLFWILFAFVLFALFGYGLLWIGLAAIWPSRKPAEGQGAKSATMLIAARNEAAVIREKLKSVLAQEVGDTEFSVLVVSDGSTDATIEEAEALNDPRIATLDVTDHKGKANALNAGLKQIDADVVIFSDANSILEEGSLAALLSHFSDPEVGGVCGQPNPIVTKSGWMAKLEKIFWQYDIALKTAESKIGGVVSAQGTLYAMRRHLISEDIPADMADDFYVSTLAPKAGLRLVQENEAVACEQVTEDVSSEFMRRVRSTERGWRGLMNVSDLMNPFTKGLYGVQLSCHKLFRRLIPFVLPVLFLLNLSLLGQGWVYTILLMGQIAVYGIGFGSLYLPVLRKIPASGLAAYFSMGHLAMGWGILRYYQGHKSVRWKPARVENVK